MRIATRVPLHQDRSIAIAAGWIGNGKLRCRRSCLWTETRALIERSRRECDEAVPEGIPSETAQHIPKAAALGAFLNPAMIALNERLGLLLTAESCISKRHSRESPAGKSWRSTAVPGSASVSRNRRRLCRSAFSAIHQPIQKVIQNAPQYVAFDRHSVRYSAMELGQVIAKIHYAICVIDRAVGCDAIRR